MAIESTHLDHPVETPEQSHETNTFGMWIFLMTELMLFGGMFAAYSVYRVTYPAGYAIGSSHLEVNLGAINTGVLLVSSLMMALAVRSAQVGSRRGLGIFLILTMLLGIVFLGLKAVEYYHHYQDGFVPGLNFTYTGSQTGPVELFFFLYFAMTGVHAIHLTIGILLVGIMFIRNAFGRITQDHWTPIELVGLYWHFVDIIWVFLFPLLYLIRPS